MIRDGARQFVQALAGQAIDQPHPTATCKTCAMRLPMREVKCGYDECAGCDEKRRETTP